MDPSAGGQCAGQLLALHRGRAGAVQGGNGDGCANRRQLQGRYENIELVINEVAAKGDPLDWFELYNFTDQVIALGNFFVADDLTDVSKRVAFPTNLFIMRENT